MDTPRRPGAFSPMFNNTPSSPPSPRSRSRSMSVDSGDDSSSVASGVAATPTPSSAAGNPGGSAKRGPTPTQQLQSASASSSATATPSGNYPPQGRPSVVTTVSSIYTSPRSNSSTPILQNYSRPTITHVVSDSLGPGPGGAAAAALGRKNSPLNPIGGVLGGPGLTLDSSGAGLRNVGYQAHLGGHGGSSSHHKRNHSQGFFEPSLPTLTDSPVSITPTSQNATGPIGFVPGGPLPIRSDSPASINMPGLTPSQIAAQAAMQSQSGNSGPNNHFSRRSQTIPSPPPLQDGTRPKAGSGSSQQSVSGMQQPSASSSRKGSLAAASALAPSSGIAVPAGVAAAGAASAAYANQLSPGLTSFAEIVPPERASRSKAERAKNIFSKSKQINVPNPKEFERKDSRAGPLTAKLPSPGTAIFPKSMNASTTSLADTLPPSSNASIYNMANSSTSTLVPIERLKSEESTVAAPKEKEKEKTYRTHIFSRPKKNKEKFEEHSIPLSSASSTSRPVDPSAPQSIYSFAQSSPAPSQTTFSKTVTGLDLRHGGRKKKDEFDFSSAFGQPSTATSHFMGGTPVGYESTTSALAGFGLNNMSSEDAWDFLKAKILVIFEGEEMRIPVEDLNRLVSVHIQRCIQRRSPIVIEDLRDLLNTGFASLDMTLRRLQEDRLVPQLVDMWLFVFGTLLPYMQAVFLPLDLELRGHGTMTPAEAADFWGVEQQHGSDGTGSGGIDPDEEMDVRKCVLLAFRDNIILPRHDALKQVFSRLSLESINVGLDSPLPPPNPHFGAGGSSGGSSGGRPGTAGSLDPGQSSYNSQGSTLISHAATASDSNRSRATSNTSSQPELPTFSPTLPPMAMHHHGHPYHYRHHAGTGSTGSANTSSQFGTSLGAVGSNTPQISQLQQLQQQQKQAQPDSSQVTETVGRVLQCMSVLVSVHSGDEAQDKMEDLTKTLKLNWLGRGRTGRNRKGLVGARVPRRATPVVG